MGAYWILYLHLILPKDTRAVVHIVFTLNIVKTYGAVEDTVLTLNIGQTHWGCSAYRNYTKYWSNTWRSQYIPYLSLILGSHNIFSVHSFNGDIISSARVCTLQSSLVFRSLMILIYTSLKVRYLPMFVSRL